MTPDKRKKIMALLSNPASTDNEKEICRKLLKGNPEDKGRPVTGYEVRDRMNRPPKVEWSDAQNKQFDGIFNRVNMRHPTSLWDLFNSFPQNMNEMAAQQRQAAARTQQNALRHEWEQRQRDASQQAAYNRHTAAAQAQTPKANYTQEEFLKAQANIDRQRDDINKSVKNLLAKAFKMVRGKHGTNESD